MHPVSGQRPNVVLVFTDSQTVLGYPCSEPGWCRFDRVYGPSRATQVVGPLLTALQRLLPDHKHTDRAALGVAGGRVLGRVRKRRPAEPWILADEELSVLEKLPADDLIVVLVGMPSVDGTTDALHDRRRSIELRVHVPGSLADVPSRMRWVRELDDVPGTIARLVEQAPAGEHDLFGPERHREIRLEDGSAHAVVNHPLKTRTTADGQSASTVVVYDEDEQYPVAPKVSRPLRAVTVVVDFDEFAHNLQASADVIDGSIDLEVIDNRGNAAGGGIAGLYAGSRTAGADGPLLFVHPDVFLPAGWTARVYAALAELDTLDPSWAVAGIAGRLQGSIDAGDTGRGRWSDPHGYRTFGDLPMAVDVLDELILITRDGSIGFDPDQPGFHCYGTDIAATAKQAGRSIWVIDAWAWHKMRRSDGSLLTHAVRSGKIANRAEAGFSDEFTLSAAWVRDKWAGRQKLQGMTEYWRDFYGEG